MERKKLRVVSVVEALKDALIEDIFRLEYRAGQRITETELCEKYDVSRNTVREAVAALQSRGLVVKEANRGVIVKKITEDDVREIFHFREQFECEAVRRIVQSGSVSEDLINAVNSIEKDPSVADDWHRFVQSDLDFHHELVVSAGSKRLARLYGDIRHELMLCLCQSKETLILDPENIYDHRQLVRLMCEGREDEAEDFMRKHIRYGIDNLMKGFWKNAE